MKVKIPVKHLGVKALTPDLGTEVAFKKCGYCGHGLWRHYRYTTTRMTVIRCPDCSTDVDADASFGSPSCLMFRYKSKVYDF